MIIENNIIQFQLRDDDSFAYERVLWISPDSTRLVLIGINNSKNISIPVFRDYHELITLIENHHVKIISMDPDLRIMSPDESYLSKYEVSRNKKWEVIKDLVTQEPDIYISKLRGKLIKETVNQTGKPKKIIYEWLKKYWFYGKSINGLLCNYVDCGVPSESRNILRKTGPKAEDGNTYFVTNKDKDIFEKAIRKFHVSEGKSIKETYRHMVGEFYHEGYYRKHGVLVPIVEEKNCPTERQFRYWYNNQYNVKQKYSAKYGNRKGEMEARAFMGTPEEHLQGPGALFEVDSTPADIILMSVDHQTEIGRAHVYFVKDVMSRMIAGVHVCKNPSWEEQMVALENAATDKVDYCAKYGIEITEDEWPCHHLPKFIVGDRGEMKSRNSNNLVNLNVRVGNPPSYRGDLKPFVEQQHRHFNLRIRDLVKGAVRKEHRNRGDKNPANDAVCSIELFTKLVILYVLEFNKGGLSDYFVVTKEMYEEKVALTPISVWNWGMKRNLLHEMPRDLIRYNLLPKGEGLVTRAGIVFEKMSYVSERGLEEGWFENEQIDGKKHVEVRYDPRNCSSIFLMGRDGSLWTCYLHKRFQDYEGLHFEDVRTIIKYKNKQLKKEKKEHAQIKYELDAVAKETNKSETIITRVAQEGKSKAARHKNKRIVRKMEKRSLSSRNAWTTVRQEKTEKRSGMKQVEVVLFPTTVTKSLSNIEPTSTKINSLQAFLMTKNTERRLNRERK